MLDEIDRDILKILQSSARTSNAEIARNLGMAPSAILERIRKLEARGVISGYETRVDPKALDLELLAFVFVRASELLGELPTGRALSEIPEVLEVHHVAGEDCYLAKVRAQGTDHLGRLLRNRFGAIPTVTSTRTTIVLGTVKETGCLPLDGCAEYAGDELAVGEAEEASDALPS
jgi:Lrp/AsnC family transcriptional regulator, leucine-responsive regulatory protein